jgi:S1-C subfamily serine protease
MEKCTWKSLALLAFSLAIIGGLGCQGCHPWHEVSNSEMRRSIVRVVAGSDSGTGFFMEAPDGEVYVITAFHVVQCGCKVSIEREIEVSKEDHYIEAYPDTEIVAFDADSDLAAIRLRNVPRSEFRPLVPAAPKRDEEVLSYGYPSSALVGRLGLTRKEGRLSNMIKLPVIDHRSHTVIKENATKALIVSTDLEPGFSGGPTVDRDGKVVGVNVLKDKEHRGQDAAIDIELVTHLLEQIKPPAPPNTEEIARLLSDIQSNYLSLQVNDRQKIRETD